MGLRTDTTAEMLYDILYMLIERFFNSSSIKNIFSYVIDGYMTNWLYRQERLLPHSQRADFYVESVLVVCLSFNVAVMAQSRK